MKLCKKCGVSKPIDQFYAQPGNSDGRAGKCKECAKASVTANRNANLEHYREYDKARGKEGHRIQASIEQNRVWRSEDRRRTRCHNAVARALRAGTMTRQKCERCDTPGWAHHESYDQPLAVRWFCQVHHKERHKEMVLEGVEP